MAEKFTLTEFFQLAEQVKAALPGAAGQVKHYLEHPQELASLIEEKSPGLGKGILSAASNILEPFAAGMGLHVAKLEEGLVEVVLPDWWRNRDAGGDVHRGAVTVLGEFAARIFWERHLDLRHANMQVKQIQVKYFKKAQSDLRAVFQISEAERESLLFQLRSRGEVEAESDVKIFDRKEQLVAQVQVDWQFYKAKELSAGPAETT